MWLAVFGLWTLVGVLLATQWYITSTIVGPPVTLVYALTWVLADWYAWGALAPLVIATSRRLPIDVRTWRSAVPLHLAASVGFALVHPVLFALATCWTPSAGIGHLGFATLVASLAAKKCLTNVVMYWALVGAGHAFEYRRRLRVRELRESQLEAQLAGARLHALEMQLRPHFLFNTLNTIAELVHTDPAAADRTIVRFGDLLRESLDERGDSEIPLRRELAQIDRYLDIERTRFRDRLRVEVDAEAEALDAAVPRLILQPIVENALKHGIGSRTDAGSLTISATREHEKLVLRVRDDGPGLRADAPAEGIGLENTRARIEQLYGGAARLELTEAEPCGLEVSLAIPFRSVTSER